MGFFENNNDVRSANLTMCWSNIFYNFTGNNVILNCRPRRIKLHIKGKVFKWKKTSNVWNFSVHYSHISEIVWKKSLFFFKKRGKTEYILFFKNSKSLFFFKKIVDKVRKSDLFTGRGIRQEPRKFFKKQGKISTYV